MKPAHFINGSDPITFAPLILDDLQTDQRGDVRLTFGDWDWLANHFEADEIDGYYLNGYGLQGLVKAARFESGHLVATDQIQYDSEGDSLCIRFADPHEACVTAELAQRMLLDKDYLRQL